MNKDKLEINKKNTYQLLKIYNSDNLEILHPVVAALKALLDEKIELLKEQKGE